jgi:hypothetical protein
MDKHYNEEILDTKNGSKNGNPDRNEHPRDRLAEEAELREQLKSLALRSDPDKSKKSWSSIW